MLLTHSLSAVYPPSVCFTVKSNALSCGSCNVENGVFSYWLILAHPDNNCLQGETLNSLNNLNFKSAKTQM